MKKLVLLLTMLPLVTFADLVMPERSNVVITTYVHRLHRIGYEVLPDDLMALGNPLLWCLLFTVVAIGLILRKQETRQKLKALTECVFSNKPLNWILFGAAISAMAALGCLWFLLKTTGECREKQRDDELEQAEEWYCGKKTVYVNEPGWKYPNEIESMEERWLKARIRMVRDELQRAVDESGVRIHRTAYELEEKKDAICNVLKKNRWLKFKCRGIPVEWLPPAVRWMYVP